MREPDKIQLSCAKYRTPIQVGDKVDILECWKCYGDDQGVHGMGQTPAEAIGNAVLSILECYEGTGIPFVIDAISVSEMVFDLPLCVRK